MTKYLSPTGKCIDCEHAEWVRGSYFCNRRKIRESVLYKVGTCQRFSAKKVERKEPQTIGEEASVIANLKKENDKLRELVEDMWRPASYQVTGFQYENFKKRMRELGVKES